MILISHRGNLNGRIVARENTQSYILEAIHAGFDVEIDVWYHPDTNELFLGHDRPDVVVSLSFLKRNVEHLWVHAKNIEALPVFLANDIHCFFHKTDDVVLTSKGFIWTYPGQALTPLSICVEVPNVYYNNDLLLRCSGICSDSISKWR